jgi:5-deoxy-glucuronate isomerase
MSRLRVRSQTPDEAGRVLAITPESAGWSHIGFTVVKLLPGQTYAVAEATRETCLVVVAGVADIRAGGERFDHVGGRASPFEDAPPGAVFVPPGVDYAVTASVDVELAVCTAPGAPGYQPRRIGAAEMAREIRGQGANTRYIRNILPQDQPAHSLLVVEVVTPAGHWSSYPPHKHDTAEEGAETALEETYYHRLDPPQGFAFQRVYTDDRSLDEAVLVEDGDVVLVPRGYHPVGAPHGYNLYYLNVMAGPERRWIFRNDPQHEWIISS